MCAVCIHVVTLWCVYCVQVCMCCMSAYVVYMCGVCVYVCVSINIMYVHGKHIDSHLFFRSVMVYRCASGCRKRTLDYTIDQGHIQTTVRQRGEIRKTTMYVVLCTLGRSVSSMASDADLLHTNQASLIAFYPNRAGCARIDSIRMKLQLFS